MQAIRVAQNLKKYHHFNKGDVFALVSKNHHQLAPIVFASLCLGNPISSLDTSFTEIEMTHMLNITKPKAVFCDYDVIDVVKNALKNANNDAKIFTFLKSIDNCESFEELLIETKQEDDFQ